MKAPVHPRVFSFILPKFNQRKMISMAHLLSRLSGRTAILLGTRGSWPEAIKGRWTPTPTGDGRRAGLVRMVVRFFSSRGDGENPICRVQTDDQTKEGIRDSHAQNQATGTGNGGENENDDPSFEEWRSEADKEGIRDSNPPNQAHPSPPSWDFDFRPSSSERPPEGPWSSLKGKRKGKGQNPS